MRLLINIAEQTSRKHLFIGAHLVEFVFAWINNLCTITPIMLKINQSVIKEGKS